MASNDLNQCNFIGRLGADPECKTTPDGLVTAKFRLAVGWKTQSKEGVEWVPVNTFGKLAEICQQYLRKGSLVQITGRFRTNEWTDRDGNKRKDAGINADSMQMLGGKADGQRQDAQQAKPQQRYEPAPDLNDDIPF